MAIRVHVYPADASGCGHYRLKWPALAADEPGVEITVVDGAGLDVVCSGQGEVISVRPPECDVLVLQRPMDYRYPRAIELLRRAGVAVVVDCDDRLDCISPKHLGFAGYQPSTSPRSNWQHLAESCKAASLVTVSTPALAEVYGSSGPCRVLPNMVPARYLDIDDVPATESIGWPGWTGSHPDDLTVVRAGVARAVQRTGWGVRVVGPGDDVARQLGVPEDVVDATGFVPFVDYPEAVATIGVGIAPLRAGAFSDSKSWLKPLEMSALGVPVVMSPTPEYRRLAEMGAGVIAEKPKDWERELVRLIEDPEWWVEQSARGRAVAAGLTVEQHAWRWVAAWVEALDTR